MKTTLKSAQELVELCRGKEIRITAAESCTGGLIASYIISVSGASEIIESSYVTYSDRAKNEILGVPWKYLKKYSAVSPVVAGSMAIGARAEGSADIALSATGYAGPEGEKVGLVYIGVSTKKLTRVYAFRFAGNRDRVRDSAARMAIALAIKEIKEQWKK